MEAVVRVLFEIVAWLRDLGEPQPTDVDEAQKVVEKVESQFGLTQHWALTLTGAAYSILAVSDALYAKGFITAEDFKGRPLPQSEERATDDIEAFIENLPADLRAMVLRAPTGEDN